MPKRIEQSAMMPYTPAQLYALVNDVESYPRFLPWCQSVQLHSRSEHDCQATLTVAKAGVHQELTTSNRMEPNEYIDMQLVKGPFRHLQGLWTFESRGEGKTLVRFVMEFEFKNRIVAMALGKLFDEVAGTMVEAFRRRAHQVYAADAGA